VNSHIEVISNTKFSILNYTVTIGYSHIIQILRFCIICIIIWFSVHYTTISSSKRKFCTFIKFWSMKYFSFIPCFMFCLIFTFILKSFYIKYIILFKSYSRFFIKLIATIFSVKKLTSILINF
jgi:TRAP-type C4-dicarboxylate transport system permease small subunit